MLSDSAISFQVYPLLLSMIDDGPKKNEAGEIDFGTVSLVVDGDTSFCRIYTSDAITYPRMRLP